MSACDQAIALPVLDQTRRYKYFDRTAYEYTCDNLMSHHNINGLTGDEFLYRARIRNRYLQKMDQSADGRCSCTYADYLAAKKFCDVMHENGELNLTLPQLKCAGDKAQYPEISEKLKEPLTFTDPDE